VLSDDEIVGTIAAGLDPDAAQTSLITGWPGLGVTEVRYSRALDRSLATPERP
jgi:hypothetical protein